MLGWVDPDDLASNEELSEEVKSEK
jgi:hypothetical protein